MNQSNTQNREQDVLRVPLKSSDVDDYLFEIFLPRQKQLFLDQMHGGFFEKCDSAHEQARYQDKRLLSQCRQIYQYSHGYRLSGQEWMLEAARHGFRFLQNYRDGEFGGWYFKVTCDGHVCDDRKDLYAHAFLLFALAHYCCIDPSAQAREHIAHSLNVLGARAKDEINGGYYELCQRDWSQEQGLRLQNPHMHLLEALLAIHRACPDFDVTEEIGYVFRLFTNHLFNPVTATVGEYFSSNWQPDKHNGHRLEPGHHYEWVWLLHQLETLLPGAGAGRYSELLLDGITRLVNNSVKNGVCDELDCHGSILKSSQRIWAQTECLKAYCVATNILETSERSKKCAEIIHLLFQKYLLPNGNWIEQFGADNRILRDDLPATTGYHIMLALSEYRQAGF